MPSVEAAVAWAIDFAEDDTNGYSMPHREDPDKADCTSLTARAFKHGGFDVDVNDYSGNMLEDFTSAGFTAIPADDLDKPGDLIRGDVLLAVGEHAAIYIGDGQLVEASWDYDGEDGDSSGREIHTGDYYSHPWDWVLRADDNDEINAAGDTDDTQEDDMHCLIKPNGENRLVYYDGVTLHGLSNVDQAQAVIDAYRLCTGKDIPCFELGTEDALWASRFQEACEAAAPTLSHDYK